MFRALGRRISRIVSKSRFQDLRNDGTPELIAAFVVSIFAYDRFLQHRIQDNNQAIGVRGEDKAVALRRMLQQDDQKDESSSESSNTLFLRDSKMETKGASSSIENTRDKLKLEYGNSSTLFRCVVRKIPQRNMFDGSMSLMGVRVGEVLDVLEEGVGPDGMYNMCRRRRLNVTNEDDEDEDGGEEVFDVGWYPVWMLEKEVMD
mmetsp:Transcript_46723/g.69096  ORF Transcript_46723/g.69096 Transcript_46723/m.69096 type:complete len:204 (-) Transcript_46723:50-661(-)|eukprot:CAMPEP_0195526220 /NCGR_PEP_ID=MMETSP0794_2-20130614/27157_1 /TAXON_ID=515487 /ORGANISM="Stephanopyxis turris, Strain CCMP 815" /LENGTH=203 /DNA_ID=CAMNT_0040656851 /DNA_START=68 /DNA_END=679 /DNA_ORIENTATION=-